MNVIPQINTGFSPSTGSFSLAGQEISVDTGSFEKGCIRVFLERTDLRQKETTVGPARLILRSDHSYSAEEYDLHIAADSITVKAATDNAVIRALTTLYQVMGETGEIACGHIHDMPRYAYRGFSLDCARHFFTVEEVKRIMEQMALVKMNVFHWHLSDDQGWRIESRRFPLLHQQNAEAYYTQEDIREVLSYAGDRGIEIIPEIDLPGHVTALLAAYPQYSCFGKKVTLATQSGIYPVILCAGNEDTYTMLEELLEELCQLFPGEQFHIGGDEAPKREWKICPHCQQQIMTHGLAGEAELQGYFANRVMEILAGHGKKAICWNDSLEAEGFDTDATIQYWSPQYAEHMAPFVEKNGKFIYSDMFTLYFDYPYSMIPLKRVYEDPVEIAGIDYSDCPQLLGMEVCMWTEHISEPLSLEQRLFPRLYAAAEVMWSKERDYQNFIRRLSVFQREHHPADMGYVSEEGWNPQGKARQEDAFGFLAAMKADAHADTRESLHPNALFQEKFVNCFFEPEDLPILMQALQGLI